jgi:hypothetical protein
MPDMGGGSQQAVSSTETDVPKWLKPYALDISKGAKALSNNETLWQPYGGSSYIPPSQQEMTGMRDIAQLANGDNATSEGLLNSMGNLRDIASGRNAIDVSPMGIDNPDFRGMVNRAVSKGVDNVNSMFSGAGRYGGGANVGEVQRTASDVAGDMYAQQFNQDMDRRTAQQSANIANQAGAVSAYGQLAPMADQSRYWNAEKTMGVGAAKRGEAQAELKANMDQYYAAQNAPKNALEYYNNLIHGVTAGAGGTQTTYGQQGSPIWQILGALATGAGGIGKFMGV